MTGEMRPPSDKSITHRAVMLGALAPGTSQITNPLLGADALSTIKAMEAFGATVIRGDNFIEVTGSQEVTQPRETIDCGNAGTLIRLLAGAISGRNVDCVLDGDKSLRKRPMERISKPLRAMGAKITSTPEGTPPLAIEATDSLRGIEYTLPTASAQVKSAVLLAGLVAESGTKVIEPVKCRDHTELILPSFGASVKRDGDGIEVAPCPVLRPARIEVPADISAAAFFIVAASIVPGSDITLREVCVNPTRVGVIAIMRKMGADIVLYNERLLGNEPVADIRVRHASLQGTNVGEEDVPSAIDELPVVLVAACAAEGQTTISGAAELRTKESDRLATMAKALRTVGVDLVEHEDGMTVNGGTLTGGMVDSCGDHRIAMSMAVAALRASSEIKVIDCDNVDTSFPGFCDAASKFGWAIVID